MEKESKTTENLETENGNMQTMATILTNACKTMKTINPDADFKELAHYYLNMVNSAHQGKTTEVEAILISQACTLDAIFNSLIRVSKETDYLPGTEAFFNMALKAQKQCRQTLLALADIKHPQQTTIVKQQNNAINQQINNDNNSESFEKNSTNELLKEIKNETLDGRRTLETIFTYKELETVE